MTKFLTPLDIANRACQQMGVKRITSLNPPDSSLQASEIAFNYDKLRDAELRRNPWTFAIRLAALRPITQGSTLLLVPAVWSATTMYQPGAIVSDPSGDGVLWQSNSAQNLGNTPGSSAVWDTYTGPLTVNPWNGSTTTATTVPAGISVWSSTTTYQLGAEVADAIGNLWVSTINNNLNNNPGASIAWNQASASQTILNPSSYYAGELVYITNGSGTTYIFVSLTNNNTAQPTTPTAWSSQTTYNQGQVVSYLGFDYVSMLNLNTNNNPGSSPAPWQNGITYAAGATVAGINGLEYYSLAAGNLGNDPTTTTGFWGTYGTPAPWMPNFVGTTVSGQWGLIAGTLAQINIIYPLGTGPSQDSLTKNIFMLPNGFLRKAPQDPKRGSTSYLGAPGGAPYDDWDIQDDFLVSSMDTFIILRFVADITNVLEMDPMFCEGLAARIGIETVERLTESTVKKSSLLAAYNKFMGEAREVNGIEGGPIEPPEDDWITTRI